MEGQPIEFKPCEGTLSKEDFRNIKNKQIVKIDETPDTINIHFIDDSVFSISSSRMVYLGGINIADINERKYKHCYFSDFFLQSDNTILIELNIPYDNMMLYDVDVGTIKLSYNEMNIEFIGFADGKHIAQFGKLIKAQRYSADGDQLIAVRMYFDDGTYISISKNCVISSLRYFTNYGEILSEFVGQKIIVEYHGSSRESIFFSFIAEDVRLFAAYGGKGDITYSIGG